MPGAPFTAIVLGTEAASAEERLRRAREAVAALDDEVESLASELADFGRSYEAWLGELQRTLDGAEALAQRLAELEGRLRTLADQVTAGELDRPPRRGRSKKKREPRRREEPPPSTKPAPAEDSSAALKRLYRQLARLLHPDLTRDEEEARRLGALMASVNAAYAAGDLAALQILSERHGGDEPPADLAPAERVQRLSQRAVTLERIAASLTRERDRLRRSDTYRLLMELRRCKAEGLDFLEQSRADIDEELTAARADALARLSRIDRAAEALSRARSRRMKIVKQGTTAVRRGFDPLKESAVVRAGASRLERARATGPARELARWMEDAESPEVALTLLAFFAEESGARPPAALESAAAWAGTWASLGHGELAAALGSLPPHLSVGARLQGQDVVAGVQLASAELAAGVRLSLSRPKVAAQARRVLAALGPRETCPACGEAGPALHHLRTRGLDEHHGLGCPHCGTLLRSYWRYGEPEGLEALAPYALELGLVDEVTVDLAGCSIGLQMLPAQRRALTAGGLRQLFAELYLEPYEVELDASDLRVMSRRKPLSPRARVPEDVRIEVSSKDLPAEELLEILRARIERRFRP